MLFRQPTVVQNIAHKLPPNRLFLGKSFFIKVDLDAPLQQ